MEKQMKTYQLNDDLVFLYENPVYKTRPYLSVDVPVVAIPHGKLAVWETELIPDDINFGKQGTGQWVIKDDNRKAELYNTTDGDKYEGDYNGIGDLPDDVTIIARPSEDHTWVDGEWWIDPAIELERAIGIELSKIDAWVRAKEYEPIEYNGDVFRGESKDRELLSNTVSMIELIYGGTVPDGLVWRSMTNVNHVFTVEDYKSLATAFATRTQMIYAQSWAYKELLRASTTQQELEQVVADIEL